MFHFVIFSVFRGHSDLKAQLPMLSSGSRASTPLKGQADEIRQQLSELGEDAAEVGTSLFLVQEVWPTAEFQVRLEIIRRWLGSE